MRWDLLNQDGYFGRTLNLSGLDLVWQPRDSALCIVCGLTEDDWIRVVWLKRRSLVRRRTTVLLPS